MRKYCIQKKRGKGYPYPYLFSFNACFTGTKDWHKSTNSDAAYLASAASFSALRPILSSSSVLALNASNACTGFSLPFAAATCSAVCASVKRQYLYFCPKQVNRRCSVRICTVLLSKASKASTMQRCLPASLHASAYIRASQDMLLNRHPWRLQRPPPPESTSVCVLLYQ